MTRTWLWCQPRQNISHSLPQDDLVEHSVSPWCVCGPSLLPVRMALGVQGSLYVHASLDGRELVERSSS